MSIFSFASIARRNHRSIRADSEEPRRAKAQSDFAVWKAGKVASFEMPLARLGAIGDIAIIAYTP
jgi:hypothetical protein